MPTQATYISGMLRRRRIKKKKTAYICGSGNRAGGIKSNPWNMPRTLTQYCHSHEMRLWKNEKNTKKKHGDRPRTRKRENRKILERNIHIHHVNKMLRERASEFRALEKEL